ncbi:MAG: asparagine synthase C-terminal domain-containing protein [Anaerolineae bacterium]|nr:asparagine synthase C-terminal domain-containing protein [Anaerolineae bacterium]
MLFTHTIPLRGRDRLVFRMLPATGKVYTENLLNNRLLTRGDGVAVVDNTHPKGVLLARAQPNIVPLYYRVDKERRLLHLSTNKHKLKAPVQTVGDGSFVLLSETGEVLVQRVYDRFDLPDNVQETMDQAADRVEDALETAIRVCLGFHPGKKLALGLSGGRDSAVIAFLLHRLGVDFKAYTTYINEENSDYIGARKVAEFLGLDWTPVHLNLKTVYPLVRRAVYACERTDYTNAGMSVGRVAMGDMAAKDGIELFMMGDGADGSFGGGIEWGKAKKLAVLRKWSLDRAWAQTRAIHVEQMHGYLTSETKSFGFNGLEWISPFLIWSLLETILSLTVQTNPHHPEKMVMRTIAARHMPQIETLFKKVGFVTGNGMNAQKKQGMFTDEFYRAALDEALLLAAGQPRL